MFFFFIRAVTYERARPRRVHARLFPPSESSPEEEAPPARLARRITAFARANADLCAAFLLGARFAGCFGWKYWQGAHVYNALRKPGLHASAAALKFRLS